MKRQRYFSGTRFYGNTIKSTIFLAVRGTLAGALTSGSDRLCMVNGETANKGALGRMPRSRSCIGIYGVTKSLDVR
jgi:hypothetical protein